MCVCVSSGCYVEKLRFSSSQRRRVLTIFFDWKAWRRRYRTPMIRSLTIEALWTFCQLCLIKPLPETIEGLTAWMTIGAQPVDLRPRGQTRVWPCRPTCLAQRHVDSYSGHDVHRSRDHCHHPPAPPLHLSPPPGELADLGHSSSPL